MAEPAARTAPGWRAWAGTIHALSWRDRALLVEATCLLTIAAPLVRVFGVGRLTARLGGIRPDGAARRAPRDPERARAIARLVGTAARHTPVSNTCLHRSLTLWWLLGRRGFASDFVLGARKRDGRLEAHAWVEHQGAAINDDPAVVGEYLVLSRTRRE